MIGFLGSDVGPGAISDATNDCPRHIPADSTTKQVRHLNIYGPPRNFNWVKIFLDQRKQPNVHLDLEIFEILRRRETVTQSFAHGPLKKAGPERAKTRCNLNFLFLIPKKSSDESSGTSSDCSGWSSPDPYSRS